MTAENCLEGRRSIQLSYRGKPQNQRAFSGFPLCFQGENQTKAVRSLPLVYAEVCRDVLRSERKGVLESVLFKLGGNGVYFLQLLFRKTKNIKKQRKSICPFFLDTVDTVSTMTPSKAIRPS